MNIDEMPAGSDLDALIAEKVLGWSDIRPDPHCTGFEGRPLKDFKHCLIPRYSTNIADAWKVAEVASKGEIWAVTPMPMYGGKNPFAEGIEGKFSVIDLNVMDGWGHIVSADTAPLAICRAALLSL